MVWKDLVPTDQRCCSWVWPKLRWRPVQEVQQQNHPKPWPYLVCPSCAQEEERQGVSWPEGKPNESWRPPGVHRGQESWVGLHFWESSLGDWAPSWEGRLEPRDESTVCAEVVCRQQWQPTRKSTFGSSRIFWSRSTTRRAWHIFPYLEPILTADSPGHCNLQILAYFHFWCCDSLSSRRSTEANFVGQNSQRRLPADWCASRYTDATSQTHLRASRCSKKMVSSCPQKIDCCRIPTTSTRSMPLLPFSWWSIGFNDRHSCRWSHRCWTWIRWSLPEGKTGSSWEFQLQTLDWRKRNWSTTVLRLWPWGWWKRWLVVAPTGVRPKDQTFDLERFRWESWIDCQRTDNAPWTSRSASMASNPDFTAPQCKRESFVWRSERRNSFHSYPSKQAA